MSAAIDVTNPEKPKRVAIVASNPGHSKQTGWPIGFWWAELVHPYWEFVEAGYQVEVFSPDGGKLQGDKWSDPRDDSKYSVEDLLSLGFIHSPDHCGLVENSKSLKGLKVENFDAILFVGGQGPMYTFYDDERVHQLAAEFYEAGKITAVICHATCILLRTKLSTGKLLVEGKTWTGFANSEEQYADAYVGHASSRSGSKKKRGNWRARISSVNSRFRPFAVRDGRLITGQQQYSYSGTEAARLVIETLGG